MLSAALPGPSPFGGSSYPSPPSPISSHYAEGTKELIIAMVTLFRENKVQMVQLLHVFRPCRKSSRKLFEPFAKLEQCTQ